MLLCSSNQPGTCYIDWAILELRDFPTSAFTGLELKAGATTPSQKIFFVGTVSDGASLCASTKTPRMS